MDRWVFTFQISKNQHYENWFKNQGGRQTFQT